MKGIDEAKAFYEEYGREMIRSKFPEYESRIAVGLAGHGSECYGYDDEISRDHDFTKGFCLWITDADDILTGIELAKAYRELPIGEAQQNSALGGGRGVSRIGFFYRRYTGSSGAPRSLEQWIATPENALCEAANGQVWRDDLGAFTAEREKILYGMPEDARKKKLSARAALMAQSGQYNYARCLKRGQQGAAMLALNEFVKASGEMIYLLNKKHSPYYKWMFKGMEELKILGDMREPLEFLLLGDNDDAGLITKSGVVEDICAAVIKELKNQKLTDGNWDYLEPHAFEIAERIEDDGIRAMHIMEG